MREYADLAAYVGFGLRAELDNVASEILTGLASAGQHSSPIGRRHIFYDDRNRRLCLREGGHTERNAPNDASRYHKLLHDHTPRYRAQRPLNWMCNCRPVIASILKVRSEPSLRNVCFEMHGAVSPRTQNLQQQGDDEGQGAGDTAAVARQK